MSDTWSDPTRSGPPLGIAAGETLSLSHNEIQSLCFKAARGAGRPWGIAEEAGFAAAWLASHHIDGVSVLAEQLGNTDGLTSQSLQPCVRPGQWQSDCPGQSLCPIAVGVTLIDFLGVDAGLFSGAGLVIDAVSHPILAVPFIALAAEELKTSLTVRLDDHGDDYNRCLRISACGELQGEVSFLLQAQQARLRITADAGAVDYRAVDAGAADAGAADISAVDAPVSASIAATGISVSPSSMTDTTAAEHAAPVTLDGRVLAQLDSLAMRTTVPSSSRSRADAGADSRDSD